jgi:hypothetical protein
MFSRVGSANTVVHIDNEIRITENILGIFNPIIYFLILKTALRHSQDF